MKHLNKIGYVDLQHKSELEELIKKIIKAHKPNNQIEYGCLNNSINIEIGYRFAVIC